MKKRLLILSLVAVCLSLCISGTLAYYTATERGKNVITAGNIKIELIETDGEGNPFKDVTGVMPGMEVDKIVNVKNTGDNPCWVRIALNKEIKLRDGLEGTPDPQLVGLDLDTEYWMEKDGFYYYKKKLPAGEVTGKPLFTKVTFDTAMDNMYQGSTANIIIGVQAVQSANNGADVLEAKGWPAP